SLPWGQLRVPSKAAARAPAGLPPQLMQVPRLILVQAELGPQINTADLFVGRQAVARAALENHSVVHDVGAVGDPEGRPDVVVGDEHADAAIPQMKDDLLDVADGDGIDAGEWLVEQDE